MPLPPAPPIVEWKMDPDSPFRSVHGSHPPPQGQPQAQARDADGGRRRETDPRTTLVSRRGPTPPHLTAPWRWKIKDWTSYPRRRDRRVDKTLRSRSYTLRHATGSVKPSPCRILQCKTQAAAVELDSMRDGSIVYRLCREALCTLCNTVLSPSAGLNEQ